MYSTRGQPGVGGRDPAKRSAVSTMQLSNKAAMTSPAKTSCWEPGVDEFPVWARKTATEFATTVINTQDLARRRLLLRNHNICTSEVKQTPVVFTLNLFLFRSRMLSLSSPSLSSKSLCSNINIRQKPTYKRDKNSGSLIFSVRAVDLCGFSPVTPG